MVATIEIITNPNVDRSPRRTDSIGGGAKRGQYPTPGLAETEGEEAGTSPVGPVTAHQLGAVGATLPPTGTVIDLKLAGGPWTRFDSLGGHPLTNICKVTYSFSF